MGARSLASGSEDFSAHKSAMITTADLHTVDGVLGHKNDRSTQRYAHLATRSLAAAILKVR